MFKAIGDKQPHVPYCNTKLTLLLQVIPLAETFSDAETVRGVPAVVYTRQLLACTGLLLPRRQGPNGPAHTAHPADGVSVIVLWFAGGGGGGGGGGR